MATTYVFDMAKDTFVEIPVGDGAAVDKMRAKKTSAGTFTLLLGPKSTLTFADTGGVGGLGVGATHEAFMPLSIPSMGDSVSVISSIPMDTLQFKRFSGKVTSDADFTKHVRPMIPDEHFAAVAAHLSELPAGSIVRPKYLKEFMNTL